MPAEAARAAIASAAASADPRRPGPARYGGSVVALAGELEGRDPERRHPRGREEELAGQLGVAADLLDVAERLDDRLREPEVLHGVPQLAILDQPGPIPGHAGDDGLLRMDDVRV